MRDRAEASSLPLCPPPRHRNLSKMKMESTDTKQQKSCMLSACSACFPLLLAGCWLLLFATTCHCLLLPAAACCCLVLLAGAACCCLFWLLLPVAACCCLLLLEYALRTELRSLRSLRQDRTVLVVAVCCWLLLAVAGCCWLLLRVAADLGQI